MIEGFLGSFHLPKGGIHRESPRETFGSIKKHPERLHFCVVTLGTAGGLV
jgi:hypothetical protein